jgi:hypothetical protein
MFQALTVTDILVARKAVVTLTARNRLIFSSPSVVASMVSEPTAHAYAIDQTGIQSERLTLYDLFCCFSRDRGRASIAVSGHPSAECLLVSRRNHIEIFDVGSNIEL